MESKKDRTEMGCLKSNNLTYGEIDFTSIAECFCFIKNRYGAFKDNVEGNTYKFVDLGHGTGKGVLAASLIYPWKECTGIELLVRLFNQSMIHS